MDQKTIYIETYGCSANQNNSEILAGILSQAGNIITNNEEMADIIIINSCVVKGKTESKIKRRIQDLKAWANVKGHLLIIAGCMPQTDWKKLKKINNSALLLGTHHFKDILNLIRDWKERKLDEKKEKIYLSETFEKKLSLPKIPRNNLISITQISEGCLGECSFCKTRLAKGKLQSYTKEDIIKSIESDLQQGAKEIWLTSQDNAAYGLDKGKRELPNLLKEILALKYRFKLRLGMMNPNNIIPIANEMIEIYKNPKIFKFVHIPIQSASNKILKEMNRGYTIEQVENLIEMFRKEFQNITIETDIISAYPKESEEDHAKNFAFIENYKPEILNLSKFSSHKGTEAGKLKVLPSNIVRKRTKELMEIHRKTRKDINKKYIGKTVKVLVEKKISEYLYKARDENYNSIIINGSKKDLGKEITIKIIDAGLHTFIGKKDEKNAT